MLRQARGCWHGAERELVVAVELVVMEEEVEEEECFSRWQITICLMHCKEEHKRSHNNFRDHF